MPTEPVPLREQGCHPDWRSLNARQSARCALHGVPAGELVRMLRQVKPCVVGPRDSPLRSVRIVQDRSALTIASGYGPFALATSTPVVHHGPRIAIAANARQLLRELRRVPRDWRPLLQCDADTVSVMLGQRLCGTLPLTAQSDCPPLAGEGATPCDTLDMTDATDWFEVADVLHAKPPKKRVAQLLEPPRIELSATSLRLHGRRLDLRIEHSAHASLGAAQAVLAFPARMNILVAAARAYVASAGQVAVMTLEGRERFVRYAFGRLALTIQTTGSCVEDAALMAEGATEDDDEEDD